MKRQFVASGVVAASLALGPGAPATAQTEAVDHNDDVNWVVELALKDGKESQFETLKAEMTEMAENAEPGTHAYLWLTSGDTIHQYERYDDSEAALAHLANFDDMFAERYLDTFDITGLTVWGSPSEELRAKLEGFGAVIYEPVAGFAR